MHANFMLRLKPDLLAASDMLLSPVDNTQETFGLSLLEAQAAGLPVVASRFDGYKDLIDDGVDGFLIDTWWCEADPAEEFFDLDGSQRRPTAAGAGRGGRHAAARRSRAAIDRRRGAARAEMGRRGREKVEREYRFSAIVRRYESLWDDLARDARAWDFPLRRSIRHNFGAARLFNHYATRTIAPGDRLVATGASDAAGRAPHVDAAYNETRPLLHDALAAMIHAAATPITAADLIALAGDPADRAWSPSAVDHAPSWSAALRRRRL